MNQALIKSPFQDPAFSFVIRTNGSNDTFQLPLREEFYEPFGGGDTCVYDFTVDWGDGSNDDITSWNQSETLHTYAVEGDYTIRITGKLDYLNFYFGTSGGSMAGKMRNFLNWGNVGMRQYFKMFAWCINMSYAAKDAPDFSDFVDAEPSLDEMFNYAGNFNSDSVCTGNFTAWDVSGVHDFTRMFENCTYWDLPGVEAWQPDEGRDFTSMFESMDNFNQDLSRWRPVKSEYFNNFINNSTSWSNANYDKLLVAWSQLTWDNSNLTFDCEAQYTESAARAILTGAPNNWTINDGGGI